MACLRNVLATLKAEVGFGIKGYFSRLSGLSLPLHDDSVRHSAPSLAVHLETSGGMFPSPCSPQNNWQVPTVVPYEPGPNNE
nr:hypothetical protein [Klebsiella pneumoniae]USC09162.1 hypothetical protein K4908_01100 [Klebsiella pneumoniae]